MKQIEKSKRMQGFTYIDVSDMEQKKKKKAMMRFCVHVFSRKDVCKGKYNLAFCREEVINRVFMAPRISF